jgi:hypothetical protein
MSAWDHFTVELLADREFASSACEINNAITALDLEADGNPHALQLFEGVMWIARQRQRPLRERVEAIFRLVSLRGKVVVNLREFCGW